MPEMDRTYYRALPTIKLIELGREYKPENELMIAIADRLEDDTIDNRINLEREIENRDITIHSLTEALEKVAGATTHLGEEMQRTFGELRELCYAITEKLKQ